MMIGISANVAVWLDSNDKWWEIMGGHNPNFDAKETANPDVGGAVVSGILYTAGYLVSGNEWNWTSFGVAVVGGAISSSIGTWSPAPGGAGTYT